MRRASWWAAALVVLSLASQAPTGAASTASSEAAKKGVAAKPAANDKIVKITKTEEQWKKQLTPEQYRVLRESGTERAFTGKYWDNHAAGIYKCAACGLDLFDSKTKFESGTGWPSFWTVIPGHVEEHRDTSLGMLRVEVLCARCGGHLGHVFDDGPEPTGLRYCINSVSLAFDAKK
jgi:peptide-methionine (R)-S-oxide reductase